MLACVCQPVSSKHLYSSTKTNVRKLTKPPVRVIRITNSVLSKLDTDENRNILFELTNPDNFENNNVHQSKNISNKVVSIKNCNNNNNYNNNNDNNNNNHNNNNNVFKKSKCKINRLKSLSSSSSESEQSDNSSYCSSCSKSGFSSSSKEENVVVTKEPKRVPFFEPDNEKEEGNDKRKLPDGVELSLWELQEMATRQQQQIESQHQILVAKEQRLRYLKHQEARTHQVAAENERLRRLKERVEAQELKLKKLRALRGQVDQDKISNGTLTSDLDSIRALFNEKEKELSLAVAKVEELTRQLEELKRNGRTKEAQNPAAAALELDKLRRELLFRNKLKEQQNTQLNQQRDALNQRQEEINSIDKRITELQDRLHRKRLLNQQLANQLQQNNNNNNINNNNNKQIIGGVRPAKSTSGLLSNYQKQRQNVAAVEPYLHVPNVYHQQNELIKPNNTEESYKNATYQKQIPKAIHKTDPNEGVTNENNKNKNFYGGETGKDGGEIKTNNIKEELSKINAKDAKNKDNNSDYLTEFSASKSDPKYQTLPYNTKFAVNYNKNTITYQNGVENHLEHGDGYLKSTGVVNPVGSSSNVQQQQQQQQAPNQQQQLHQPQQQQQQQQQHLMTVHSTPIPAPSLSSASRIPSHLNPRVFGHQSLASRGQPVGGTSPSSSTSSLATTSSSSSCSNLPRPTYNIPKSTNVNGSQLQYQHQKSSQKIAKPISSVAPTNIVQQQQQQQQKTAGRSFIPTGEKPSPIYQTSSTKILPVQPQTLGSTPQGVSRDVKGELSPPISSSTPLGTPEVTDSRTSKPALPPKPAVPVKPTPPPPPRQGQSQDYPESKGYIEITAESLDQALNLNKGNINVNTRIVGSDGGMSNKIVSSDEVPFESDRSRTPTPPPPPPPTTEPPDDISLRRIENVENISKDDKIIDINDSKLKSNQSSNLVNCNHSGTQINNISSSNLNNNNGNHLSSSGSSSSSSSSSSNSRLQNSINSKNNNNNDNIINKNNLCESNSGISNNNNNIHVSINRRIEMPPAFMFPENEDPPADLIQPATQNDGSDGSKYLSKSGESKFTKNGCEVDLKNSDELDRIIPNDNDRFISNKIEENEKKSEIEEVEALNNINAQETQNNSGESVSQQIVRRVKKGNLKSTNNKSNASRRVSFDPLALLLDASLEGELELVMKTASQVSNPSAANDEGITALHNAICAGHLEIVKFLVEFGCDVNAQDSDGWTPLHCAASCNNLAMVRFLVEHGACIFATTLSDHETAAEKCEEDEEGFDGCSEYLYSIQEKLGILNSGVVYAVYDYLAHNNDELSFKEGDRLVILRKGDEMEREWWWSRLQDKEGYVPRNLLGLYPRVQPNKSE